MSDLGPSFWIYSEGCVQLSCDHILTAKYNNDACEQQHSLTYQCLTLYKALRKKKIKFQKYFQEITGIPKDVFATCT